MGLQIYQDAQCRSALSSGDMSNPDAYEFNGTDGQIRDQQFFLSASKSFLAAAINDVQNFFYLQTDVFTVGGVVSIGDELIQITNISDGAIGVRRGFEGTEPTSHEKDVPVLEALRFVDVEIAAVDNGGSGLESWLAFALEHEQLDGSVPGQALPIGQIAVGEVISFWRRCIVPAGTPARTTTQLKIMVCGRGYSALG